VVDWFYCNHERQFCIYFAFLSVGRPLSSISLLSFSFTSFFSFAWSPFIISRFVFFFKIFHQYLVNISFVSFFFTLLFSIVCLACSTIKNYELQWSSIYIVPDFKRLDFCTAKISVEHGMGGLLDGFYKGGYFLLGFINREREKAEFSHCIVDMSASS
jgi:hypothetical protein